MANEDNLWQAHNQAHELLATAVRDARGRADGRADNAAPESEVLLRWQAHDREHHLMEDALNKALTAVDKAIVTALDAVNRERTLHSQAHDREHFLQNQALEKAEHATEVRFTGVNEFREQLRDQASRLATQERVDALVIDINRRFDETRLSITNIEKGESKSDGKSLGQAATFALIVGSIAAASGIASILLALFHTLH